MPKRRKKRTTKIGYAASGTAGYLAGGFASGVGMAAKIGVDSRKKAVKRQYKKYVGNPETKKYLKNVSPARAAALRKKLKTKARATKPTSADTLKASKKYFTLKGKKLIPNKRFKKIGVGGSIAGAALAVAAYRKIKNRKSKKRRK